MTQEICKFSLGVCVGDDVYAGVVGITVPHPDHDKIGIQLETALTADPRLR